MHLDGELGLRRRRHALLAGVVAGMRPQARASPGRFRGEAVISFHLRQLPRASPAPACARLDHELDAHVIGPGETPQRHGMTCALLGGERCLVWGEVADRVEHEAGGA